MNNPHMSPAIPIAAAVLHDKRTIFAMDLGEAGLPLLGRQFRFGLFEQDDAGNLRHVEGGIMAHSKRAISTEFEIYCKEQSGLKVVG